MSTRDSAPLISSQKARKKAIKDTRFQARDINSVMLNRGFSAGVGFLGGGVPSGSSSPNPIPGVSN